MNSFTDNWWEISLEASMKTIAAYCNEHPTCEGCRYNKKHIGCVFRGRSPREWEGDYSNEHG